MRLISPGELFAAPAMFGNGVAPATVISQVESQVLTIDREALLTAISHTPEIRSRPETSSNSFSESVWNV